MTSEANVEPGSTADPRTDAPVWCRIDGRCGRITLNRPHALNALNEDMIDAIAAALTAWGNDPAVDVVAIDGAGERGLCAGGDLGTVHRAASSDPEPALRLWRREYALDAQVARYPLPVVALMDGIVMGGGLGLTVHADCRIVTERSVLAMPEVGIGLAPDVGASLFLSRAPGRLGRHLALTGARIGAEDAIACGLADHRVAAADLPQLSSVLRAGRVPFGPDATPTVPTSGDGHRAPILRARDWIDACYAADSVPEILRALRSRPEQAARDAASAIEAASPTALAITLRALRTAGQLADLEECLSRDYRLVRFFLGHPDLAEGIRAAVLDKDRSPVWTPDRLSDVAEADVAAAVAPLGADEWRVPRPARGGDVAGLRLGLEEDT